MLCSAVHNGTFPCLVLSQWLFSVENQPGRFVFPSDLCLLAMRHVCITDIQEVVKDVKDQHLVSCESCDYRAGTITPSGLRVDQRVLLGDQPLRLK